MNSNPVPQTGSSKQRPGHLFLWLAALLTVGVVTASCGSDGDSDETFVDTYDSYFQSFSAEYNPSPSVEDLSMRSTVAVEAVLVDVEDGRYFGASETEIEGVTLNLVFQTEDKTQYYVQLSRPMDSSVEGLRSVLPIGARSVIYLQPNNDPLEGVWFNVREDGNEWYFTTPQGWILDHPERGIVFPLEERESESPFAETPAATRESIGDWLVSEEQG